jgi:Uma2 family endonuclease
MEANRSRQRWSYAEFARLPSEGSTRYEVIDGELAMTPAPTSGHQEALTELVSHLNVFVREHALGRVLVGPVDVLFGEGDYLEPDLVFVRTDRLELVSERGVEGPPDLVVEILSPSTAHRDRGVKLARYRHFAVPEYWVVDLAARAVEVWRLEQGMEVPEVVSAGERLEWTPIPGSPTLELDPTMFLPAPPPQAAEKDS